MSLPVVYSKFAGLHESESGVIYGAYYYENADLFEVWRHRDETLMGVYSRNTLVGACTNINLAMQKLTRIWEGVGLYKTYGPGWEKKVWNERPKRPQRTSRPEPAPAPVLARITAATAAKQAAAQAAPAQAAPRQQSRRARREQIAMSFC